MHTIIAQCGDVEAAREAVALSRDGVGGVHACVWVGRVSEKNEKFENLAWNQRVFAKINVRPLHAPVMEWVMFTPVCVGRG